MMMPRYFRHLNRYLKYRVKKLLYDQICSTEPVVKIMFLVLSNMYLLAVVRLMSWWRKMKTPGKNAVTIGVRTGTVQWSLTLFQTLFTFKMVNIKNLFSMWMTKPFCKEKWCGGVKIDNCIVAESEEDCQGENWKRCCHYGNKVRRWPDCEERWCNRDENGNLIQIQFCDQYYK